MVQQGTGCGCSTGMVQGTDTRGHCCWPGQVWAASQNACVGPPTRCPVDQVPSQDNCVPDPAIIARQQEEARREIAERQRQVEEVQRRELQQREQQRLRNLADCLNNCGGGRRFEAECQESCREDFRPR